MNCTIPSKPALWKVVKATGGTSFIERGNKRFPLPSDEDAIHEICDQLNRYERETVRLKNRLDEITSRT